MTETNQVIHGDCWDELVKLPDNSIDTIITDPPYGLKFMGKNWDHGIPGIPFWAEMLRVAKPGATLLAFGGTRTHHRLMVAIEDAGWEIRDCLMWLYGSGFPKSLSIGKAIDKATITDCANCDGKGFVIPDLPSYEELITEDPDNHITYEDWLYFQTPEGIIARQYKCADCNGTGKVKGKEREVVGQKVVSSNFDDHDGSMMSIANSGGNNHQHSIPITAPATEAAKTWEGWHSPGLKPAYEPIILAMKPIEKNYANNAQVWGVSGLNIDGARIDDKPLDIVQESFGVAKTGRWPSNVLMSHSEGCVYRGEKRIKGITGGKEPKRSNESNTLVKGIGNNGRQSTYVDYADSNGLETVADWICVEDCAIRILDEQAGVRKSGEVDKRNRKTKRRNNDIPLLAYDKRVDYTRESSSGSASRFFYTSKAPNREKWFYCQLCQAAYPNKERDDHGHDIPQDQRKHIVAHPTTKPLTIMKYLATLTKTPTGGIVLDPFAGSGTTALACIETGRDFILIEKESDYYEIAKARVADAMSEPRQAELW